MAAGSVRLPDLTQKITVDTKDLDRAVLAARAFKSEMNKSLDSSGASGADQSLADLEKRLTALTDANEKFRASNENVGKSFRDQQGDIDNYASSLSRAEGELRKFSQTADSAFKIDTSKWQSETDKVAEKMKTLSTDSEELRKSQEDLGQGFRNTREEVTQADDALQRLEAENAKLRTEVDATSGEVTRLEQSLATLSNQVARAGSSQDDFAKRTKAASDTVKGAAKDAEAAQAQVAAATNKYNDALAKEEVASQKATAAEQKREAVKQTATRLAEEQTKAEADLEAIQNRGAASADEIATATDRVSKARQASEKAASAEATAQARLTDAESKAFIVEGQREQLQARADASFERVTAAALKGTAATEAGTRAMQEQEAAEANLLRVQNNGYASADSLAAAQDRLSKANQAVASTAGRVSTAQAQMQEAATRARAFEDELANAEENLNGAQQKVTAAQQNLNATRTAATRATEDYRKAETDLQALEQQGAASADEVEAATRKVAAAKEAASKAAANEATSEARVTDAYRNHVNASRDVEKATTDLAKAQDNLSNSSSKASKDIKDAKDATASLSSVTGLATSAITGLFTGIKSLAIGGVVAGGIGILGSSVIGLAAGAAEAVPAALALTGAIGGLGVTVLGLKAIFSDNKGLKPALDELKKSFEGIQTDLQNRVNPSIIAFLKQVEQMAPLVRAQVPAFAAAFTEITNRLTNLLKDSGFQADLTTIMQSGIRQFQLFGDAGAVALRGIIGLAAATGPYVEKLGVLAGQVAQKFTDWVASARQTGELDTLIQNATKTLETMLGVVENLAVGFKNLFEASNVSGFTDAVLGALTTITTSFRTFTRDRQADLQAMFANLSTQVSALPPLFDAVANGIRVILTKIDLRPLISGLIAILPNLAGGLVDAANAAARLGQLAAPAINAIITAIRGLIPDVEKIGAAFLTNVMPAINAVAPGIQRLGDAIANIASAVLPVLGAAARTVGDDFSFLVGLIAPIAEAVGALLGSLGNFSALLGNIAVGLVALKVGQAIFSGLGAAINGTAEPANKLQKAIVGVADTAKTVATGVRVAAIDMTQAYTDTSTKVQSAFSRLGESVNTATEGIRTGLQNSQAAFKELGANAEEGGHRVVEAFANAAAGVVGGSEKMIGGFGGVVGGMGKVAGAAAGVGSALKSGFTSAAEGVIGVLGGPWGIALTAAVVGLSAFQQNSQEAAQTQQQLRDAIGQSNGVIDANVTKLVQSKAETEYLSVAADKLGMSQTQVVQAFLKSGAPIDDYINKITDGAGAATGFAGIGDKINATLGSQQAQARVSAGSLKELADQTKAAQVAEQQQNAQLTATNLSMTTQQRNAQNVAQGFDKIRQSAGDSGKAVDGLSQALDGITGHDASAEKASADLTKSIDSLGQAVPDAEGKIKILGGTLDTTSKAGADFSTAADDVRTKTLAAAQAAFQQAGGLSNVQAASAAATGEINRGRDALITSAMHFGATREEAGKYADQLGLIPQTVITAIEADPAKAQQTYTDWKAGVTNASPVLAPVGANTAPAQPSLDGMFKSITAPTGGTPQVPVGANTSQGLLNIGTMIKGVGAPQGGPPQLPVGADTTAGQKGITDLQGNVVKPAAGSPLMPVGTDVTPGEQNVLAFAARINGYPAAILPVEANIAPAETATLAFVARVNGYAAAILPIHANVAPGEAEALAWVARINAYAAALLPIHANFAAFNVEMANRLADIAKAPVPVPISANIDKLNQQYNDAFAFITTNIMAAPLAANLTQLNQEYHDAYAFITTNIMNVPVDASRSFQAIDQQYRALATEIQQPLVMPVTVQFSMGGFFGLAAGGILENAQGNIAEFFADGGMSSRDRAAMKSMLGGRAQFNAPGNLNASGLSPMAADKAQIVPPNTWRVIGDRPQGDEAFIPINNSQRSEALLAETASRMGFVMQKMAQGAVASSSHRAGLDTGGASTATAAAQAARRSGNGGVGQDAPVIGTLNVQVQQDTPVNEMVSEVKFQLRRARAGGLNSGS